MRYKKNLLIILSLLLLNSYAIAQGTGLLIDKEKYTKIPRLPNYGRKNLDNKTRINLTPFCPKIMDQGENPTCTGWAVGYAAMTIDYAVNKNLSDISSISNNAFSSLFIYNQLEPSCIEGTFISDALELLKYRGNLLSKDFDYLPCGIPPNKINFDYAEKNKIKSYQTLFDDENSNSEKINAIKQSLLDSIPVIIALQIQKDIFGQTEEFYSPSKEIKPNGNHAMVVVGFDDAMGKSGAFKIMNSWGLDWGVDGFCWMDYDDFASYTLVGFNITSDYNNVITYSGSININHINPYTLIRNRVQPKLDLHRKGIYTFPNHIWNTDDRYQLNLSDVTSNLYFYAFSYDNDEMINVHFPRDEVLDNKFIGRHESALIPSSDITITIPNKDNALRLIKSGSESICILASTHPIDDFNEKLTQIQYSGKDVKSKLVELFGNRIISKNQLSLSPDDVSFSFSNVKNGIALIVLNFDIK